MVYKGPTLSLGGTSSGFGFISATEIRYWGIKAGKEVGVVFAWNEKTQKWLDELPNETQTAINNRDFATWIHLDG